MAMARRSRAWWATDSRPKVAEPSRYPLGIGRKEISTPVADEPWSEAEPHLRYILGSKARTVTFGPLHFPRSCCELMKLVVTQRVPSENFKTSILFSNPPIIVSKLIFYTV